jgi:L-ribulose-5-phosphate 4-epimerase
MISAPDPGEGRVLSDFAKAVLAANKDIFARGLAEDTFGNVSGRDSSSGQILIKPSGMAYGAIEVGDLVQLDLSGRVTCGNRRPSSDTPTHLEIYKAFDHVGGVVHTHSRFATIFAQAHMPIPCLGTTHADYFNGAIPVAHELTADEIAENYEANTGLAIVQSVGDPLGVPAILLPGHGPFCWGRTVEEAVHTAALVELVAHLAFHTMQLRGDVQSLSPHLLNKHHKRKHGSAAYYGQP